ncbi:PREDICTED: ubiA prenyltransferase domain-containing protein 1 homolog [Polistes canadensis]|uniref:ubiA prenyltransferase domain-containing protein 1 homolog n=1 Tax=Polistes canadensis TaxID=91411 RepID=UPI000718F5D8|nr:PREDICTED: ubiA prenyltransferase domain-containing protein 1 homolog [Polistes canadensis]XP_014613742.1 PREDICTED: ubiA prenyltransferase domain-containing protein 1 homolog [Polistes canadensis]XP_014613743.1 PREDICTED: ubiA prenyltransferase domain-containing protein 1 homolog [Polistes canadensis]
MMSNGIQAPAKESEDGSTLSNISNLSSTSSLTLNSPLMKLSSYFLALRPWSLSASLVPTLLGSALAYRLIGLTNFSWISLILTLCTVISVHGAGNVVNTYFDYIKGVDSRKSDDRILVDHLLSKDELVSLGALLYAVGCIGFVLLTTISPAKMEHLALVYFGGLSSSFLYTGGIGLKYIALGDVLILVIFGPISVLFAFMAQTGYVELGTIYYAIPLALNTEAILHSNNTRDLESDKKAGIVTLAILIGYTASHVLYAFLLFTPYITLVVLALRYSVWFLLPIITLPTAFKIEKQFRSPHMIQNVPKQTARLNIFLGILYVLACLLVNPLPYV